MHHNDYDDRQGSSFMMGLMAGTAIGAGIALLVTPRDGRTMRRELSNGAHRLGEQFSHGSDTVRQTARQVADKTHELIDRGKSAYRDASSQVKDAADQASHEAGYAADDAAKAARQAARQSAAAVEDAAANARRQF